MGLFPRHGSECLDLCQVRHSSAQWLFDQAVFATLQHLSQHFNVMIIWRADKDSIHVGVGQQLPVVTDDGDAIGYA
jgi:hypothetical protein